MTYTLTHYTAHGPVRGSCGHAHKTLAAARKCAARDRRACARLGGGAYSDRQAVGIWTDKHGFERRDNEVVR